MKALIVATKDVGGDNEFSDPSRLRINIEPKDCTLVEFLEAIEDAEDEDGFFPFVVSHENFIDEIAGFGPLDVGNYLCIENNIVSVEIS